MEFLLSKTPAKPGGVRSGHRIEAAKKAVKDNRLAALDRERLQKAERIGPGCVGRVCETILPAET